MKAGLYARVSSEEQAEGYSIDAQLDAMRRFCQERGWTVADEFIEPGHTATVKDRPAFSQALAACEAGALDILLTHQLDRFYRNLQLQLETLGQLGRWGVGYLSVTEQIDYSTPQGRLFMSMLGAFNEYYSANLSREVKKGKRKRAQSGKVNASSLPYGYTRKKIGKGFSDPEPDPEKAPAVVLAYETYATGEHTDQDIANLLNRRGFPPYGRKWKDRPPLTHWTRSGARKLLQNPFYAGWVKYHGNLHEGQHGAIISQELFNQAQEIRQRRRAERGSRQASGIYLLHRIARCQHCGGIMHMEYKRTRGKFVYEYYRCSAAVLNRDCQVAGRTVRMAIIDAQVAELVKHLELPDDWRGRLEELANHREERSEVEGKRRYIADKLRRLRDLYVEGDYTRAEYNRRKAKLQAKLDALQVPEAPDVEAAGATLESLGAEWANAPKLHQRDMLRVIFEAVYIDIEARRLVCVKPFPQFAPLFRMNGLKEKEGCFYYVEGKERETRSED